MERKPLASGNEVRANAPRTDEVGGPLRDNPADAWTGQYPPDDRGGCAKGQPQQPNRQGPACGADGGRI